MSHGKHRLNNHVKKDSISRTSGSMTGGVNHSDKSQLKKINNLTHKPDVSNTPKGKLYMRVKGVWVFKGTFCMRCHTTMVNQIVIDNHHYICNHNKQKHTGTDID